jgi:outer membrane protein
MKNGICAMTLALTLPAAAQATLPSAPAPMVAIPAQTAGAVPAPPAGSLPGLTREQAEQMAIRNNPRIHVGQLLALAQHQVYRETRSAELPTATLAATGVEAEEATRISAGSLTASRLLEHAGAGVNFTQLIYDFGHTHNLVLSQKLEEKSSNATALATTEEVVLATDQAFYNALLAQAELDVARQTVATRHTTDQQVRVMTRNKLKSTVDQAFADVDFSEAQLFQLDAQNNADASMAALDAILGLDTNVRYRLEEETSAPPPPPPAAEDLIHEALAQRPDLQALNYGAQSEKKYARAEWEQMLPSITAAGTAGVVPVRPDSYYTSDWWGGIGGNIDIPIFNGFLYNSQAQEAKFRAQADAEDARDLRDDIVRDVRTSWLQANTAWQRMDVTAQLLKEANLALELAQTRYRLGLSTIVELSQAQLQQTSAQIQDTSAQYQYRLALSTLNYEMGVAP